MDLSLETIKTGSYSRLKDYEQCPHRAKLKYRDKSPEPEDDQRNAAANRGTLIHTSAEQFITGEIPVLVKELQKKDTGLLMQDLRKRFAESGNIEVEQQWGFTRDWEPCDWFASTIWFRTKCDVVAHENDDCDIWVIDHKSGKRFGNEVPHSQQGLLYAINSALRYPETETFKVTMNYTDEGKLVTKKHSRETLMRMLPSFDQRIKKMTDATTWPAKPSKITCRFCPFRPLVSGGSGACAYGVEIV